MGDPLDEREGICRNVYLSTAHTSGHSDRKTHSPEREQGRGDPGEARSSKEHGLPRAISAQIFLCQVISAQLPYGSPGLLCSFTIFGFCNKKRKVLIHVNLCENYCVNSIFCTSFFLCELSLFFFFLFINVYFLKKTNQCVVGLYVTYSLVSYYRYVIRMGYFTWLFRMFYKKNNLTDQVLATKMLVFFIMTSVCF